MTNKTDSLLVYVLKFFGILAGRCGSVVVRERERERESLGYEKSGFDIELRFSYLLTCLIRVETLSIAGQIFLRSSSYEPGFRDLALPLPRCVHMTGQAGSVPEISVFSNRDLGKGAGNFAIRLFSPVTGMKAG